MSLLTKKQRLARDRYCRGRQTFTAYEQAFAVLNEQRQRLKCTEWPTIYVCPSCGQWHIGEPPESTFYDTRYELNSGAA